MERDDYSAFHRHEAAVDTVRSKKTLSCLEKLRFDTFEESHCAQTLHVGPFSKVGANSQRLHKHNHARGELRGMHYEIYLRDIRRASLDKWKTVIVQPMKADLIQPGRRRSTLGLFRSRKSPLDNGTDKRHFGRYELTMIHI